MKEEKPEIKEIGELVKGIEKEEKAKKILKKLGEEEEIILWSDTNYQVNFSPIRSQLVYRITIPIEKLREVI
jgi:hypothetical protein